MEGKLCDTLKVSRVVPVYKKGDRSLVSNNCPIAIMPAVAKVRDSALPQPAALLAYPLSFLRPQNDSTLLLLKKRANLVLTCGLKIVTLT